MARYSRAARTALRLTGWLSTLFVALTFALVACGFTVFVAVRTHVWQQ
jgi:hypothetical protein